MKPVYFLLALSLSLSGALGGQCVAPYYDLTNQLYIYENGETHYAETLVPSSVKTGRNYVAFINQNNARLRLYYAGKFYVVCENNADYWATDNWFVWKNYSNLGVLYNNELRSLDKLVIGEYWVGDSIIAWMSNFNELKVFYKGQTKTIEQLPLQQRNANDTTSNLKMGDNIMAYVDGSGQFKVFYQGEVRTLESYRPNSYRVDRDIVAYLDYSSNFKFFYKGRIFETSINNITNYHTGEGYLVYYNIGGQLTVWYNGEEITLSQSKPKEVTIQQNVIAFTDMADNFYVWYNGKLELLERYHPLSVKAYRDFLLYQDLDGRLKGYYFGKQINVSDQIVQSYDLYNETVVYSLQRGDHTFWCRGSETTITQ
jgi:hypothetical protein